MDSGPDWSTSLGLGPSRGDIPAGPAASSGRTSGTPLLRTQSRAGDTPSAAPSPRCRRAGCRLLLGNPRGSKLGRGSWNVLTPDLGLGVPLQSPTQAGGPRHADQGRALHSPRLIREPHGPHGALRRLLRHLQGEAATRWKAASTRPAARRRLGEGWGQSACRGVA